MEELEETGRSGVGKFRVVEKITSYPEEFKEEKETEVKEVIKEREEESKESRTMKALVASVVVISIVGGSVLVTYQLGTNPEIVSKILKIFKKG